MDNAGAGCCCWLEMMLELGSLSLSSNDTGGWGSLLLLWMTLGLGWRAAPLSTLELGGGGRCRRCQW